MRKQSLSVFSISILIVLQVLLTACSPGSSSSSGGSAVVGTGGVSIAYVRRPIAAFGNPTDSTNTADGGDLFIRDYSSPSGTEINVTHGYTLGHGDASDPEVSYDGTKIIFSMRCSAQSSPQCYNYKGLGNDFSWNVWEYDIQARTLRRIIEDPAVSALGDDVDPVYYPDGRIVFTSNRQETSSRATASGVPGAVGYATHDEYERETATSLHIMSSVGSNIRQISFNQSHDRNPIVLSSGEIVYSRWDHVGGRNQFSIFKINPDGTSFFVLYGAHSPGNSYLHPREMPGGRLISSLMPLSRTREGGSLEIIDVANYSENNEPAVSPGPVNQLGLREGQFQVSRLLLPDESVSRHEAMRGRGVSPLGRYSTPFPLWDGTNRVLVAYTPSQPVTQRNRFTGRTETVEGTPQYGIWMIDLDRKAMNIVVEPVHGYFFSDPIALQPRTLPSPKSDTPLDTATTGAGLGILNVKSVYDTDSVGRMGSPVLASSESIPQNAANGRADIATMKNPANAEYASRVARFFRITKAVATPAGLDRETIGESEFEMQQIVGYGVIEPDGSFTARIPANMPITITALDSQGRGFTHHTNWIQVREGEERTCNGCHSPRRIQVALNSPGTPNTAGTHPIAAGIADRAGESMSETRFAHVSQSIANLGMNPDYTDFWTPQYNTANGTAIAAQSPITITYDNLNSGPAHSHSIPSPVRGGCTAASWSPVNCSIVINYEEQIQPIWTGHCVSCHSGAAPSANLDLSASRSAVFNRYNSYEQLLVGALALDANGRPIIRIDPDNGEIRFEREPSIVDAGNARSSRLTERLFEQSLLAGSTVCVSDGAGGCTNGLTNHAGILNSAELRLLTEWMDVGAQYYNDPFDGSGQVRSSAVLLDRNVFEATIQPILMTNCAGCHQAFGGNGSTGGGRPNQNFATTNRFVLTGNLDGDFSITASMVTDVCVPANSYLLTRPSRIPTDIPPHPDVPLNSGIAALPMGSANYNTILGWISAATASATCP